MLPDGKSLAPVNEPAPVVVKFEKAKVTGLKEPTFAELH
jgi:hypothetical protein